jgi:hypothetical protein
MAVDRSPPQNQQSSADNQPLHVVVSIDLNEMATVVAEPAPEPGYAVMRLRIHAPKGLHSSYLRVVDVASGSGADERTHGAVQLDLSRELQLPRVWSESVQALGLRDAEHHAWEELRSYIVAEQRAGVDRDIELVRLHRFLGYANVR